MQTRNTRTWIKTVMFTLLLPGSVTVLIPLSLLRWEGGKTNLNFGGVNALGAIPILVGILFYTWTVSDFVRKGGGTPAPNDPPKSLVVDGLYQRVRNPMYVGVILVLLGEVMVFEKSVLLVYTTLVFIAFHLFIVGYEEPTLLKNFGETYALYCSRVPRWIPRFSRHKEI
jgi:protein-S-isoprenylcysteine O-methyltransferase Ste14